MDFLIFSVHAPIATSSLSDLPQIRMFSTILANLCFSPRVYFFQQQREYGTLQFSRIG
jgi:hypothetical protein